LRGGGTSSDNLYGELCHIKPAYLPKISETHSLISTMLGTLI